MNEKQKRIYMYKTFIDYKNKMIWLMNTDYPQKRKMVIASDMFSRTFDKLDMLFPSIKDPRKIKSPLDEP